MNQELVSSWCDVDNLEDLYNLVQLGDLLEFEREVGRHWSVYVGPIAGMTHCLVDVVVPLNTTRTLLAFNVSKSTSPRGSIRLIPITSALESKVRINNSQDKMMPPFSPETIVQRALDSCNDTEQKYDLVRRNCEHFVNFCRYGKLKSRQVENFVQTVTEIGLFSVILGVVTIVYNVFIRN